MHDREIRRVRADNGCMSITNYVQDTNPAFSRDNKNLSKNEKKTYLNSPPIFFQIQLNTPADVVRFSKMPDHCRKNTFRKWER